MTTYNIRPAECLDVRYLSPFLRNSDAQEVRASHGLSPGDALAYSFASSDVCRVLTADEIPICMFGRTPVMEESASAWMLGSNQIKKHLPEFLRRTPEQFSILHRGYPVLFNYVDERNTASIRWLRWAGAKFIQRHPEMGVENRPFLEFIHIENK